MMTDNIQQYIENTISSCLDNTITAVSSIPQEALDGVETATAIMSLSLPDNKVICLGSPLCHPLCSLFTQVLNGNHMYLTQKINAYTLNNDAQQMSHLYPNLGIDESLKVQFESIARINDTLLLISDNPNDSLNFSSIINSTHEYDIPLIAIYHHHDTVLKDMLSDNDIQIILNTQNSANFTEVVLAILNIFNEFLNDVNRT